MYDTLPESEVKPNLILPTPVYGKDYTQGSSLRLRGTPIRKDGQWKKFRPPLERQQKATETQACVTFHILAPVEYIQRALYGVATEWSDRFLAKMSGTTKYGNDPQKVCETLRKKGCVYEEEWPFPDHLTWDEFYADIPMDVQVRAQIQFKSVYNYGHEYVGQWSFASGIRGFFQKVLGAIFPRLGGQLTVTPEDMVEALKYSPLSVDVYAWNKPDSRGIYHREGKRSIHLTTIEGYEFGKYWDCVDTYPPFKKKLAWDYGFNFVKKHSLDKSVEVTDRRDPLYLWWQAIRFFKNLWTSS